MIEQQQQKQAQKVDNQFVNSLDNTLDNTLIQYLQLDNSQISKQSSKGQKSIKKDIKYIIQKNYKSFLQNWNNNIEYAQFKVSNFNLTCLYNNNKHTQFIAQFLCCTRDCLKRGVICENQKCQCQQDHKKCRIISIKALIKILQLKIRKPPNQTFYTYIQGKKSLLNFLLNIISKQRQITKQWLNTFWSLNHQNSENVASLNQYYLCVFNGKIKNCKKIKTDKNQKNSQSHKYYELVQFKDKKQRESIYGHFIKAISQTHNLIIDSFQKEIEKVQQAESRSQYLNYAQYQILKQFMAFNGSIDSGTSLKEITGNLVFIAKNLSLKKYVDQYTIKKVDQLSQIEKQNNSQQIHLKMGFDESLIVFAQQSRKSSTFDQNSLMNLKNKWNEKLSTVFYRQIEGVVFQFDQLFKEKFDKPLFYNDQNLPELIQSKLEQIFLGLQGKQIYKGKKYQSLQVSPSFITEDIFKPFSKIHLQKNLEKLKKGQCRQISLKISQGILQNINSNQLKHLTLNLYGIEKLPNNFIKSLCKKFPQMKQFHHYFLSNSQYLQKFQQSREFINYDDWNFKLSIQQCLQLSNLKQLQNIFISQVHDKRSAEIIKNMKQSIKHVSLYNNDYQRKRICKQLFQELYQIKSPLITFSLAFLQINQNDMKNIIKIIQNNSAIQTLVLYDLIYSAIFIKSQLFQCIGRNLKNLKKLIIDHQYGYNNENKIQQKDFQMLDQCSSSLKLLNLSWFSQIDKQSFKTTIHKMKNITHLILMHDNFVDDDIIQTIGSSLSKLKVLNLYQSNNVTGAGLLKLQNLKYLNTLIISQNTKIKGKDMIQLSKRVKTIKKLQLRYLITEDNRQNFTQQDLTAIDINLNQGITHLYIQGCHKVKLNCIKSLKSLKLLKISKYHFKKQDKQQLQRYAKQKEITLYYDQ